MLLFAGHDPGSKNHIRPIFDYALRLGEPAEFIDLSSAANLDVEHWSPALLRSHNPSLLICGCSMNQLEWDLVKACKNLQTPVAMVIDWGVGRRLEDIGPKDFPDRFLVTNKGCLTQLIDRGARRDSVEVVGSAHLESVSELKINESETSVRRAYALTPGANIVPFFCTPNATEAAAAVVSLAKLLPTTALERPEIIVRPHPRSLKLEPLETASRRFGSVRLDLENIVPTTTLLSASRISFSMTSTVSLEGLVLGTPSAFYQIDWDFAELDELYENVDGVPRIRSAEDLRQFVSRALEVGATNFGENLENHEGALDRSWRVIQELVQRVS